ncbi:MAG: helix-turn-helix domain-containing protein [Parabacteroides sp.]|nr:helix-turn-helix domain-containing protein [Parabacteroides sp.]
MIDILYNYSLFVGWIALFTFGSCLLMGKAPRKEAYHAYNRSRRIMGAAFILFGVQILLQWLFEFRTFEPHIASAMNITCFYMEAILFGMSFISLLNTSYITRRRVVSDFGKWAACMAALWSATLGLEGTPRTVIQITAAVFFLWQACLIIRIFFRTYHRAKDKVDNYYADNVNGFVKWLYKSTFGIIFFGLTSAIIAFAPKWGIVIQMTAGIFMFFYIFNSFMNYLLNYDSVKRAATNPPDEDSIPYKKGQGEAYHKKIEVALHQWVASEGFLENGITIEQLANLIPSNRTYLSNFINTEFKCSFSSWINNLRMEYAKRLLIDHPKMPIEQIACDSGFSSSCKFGKRFKEIENMTASEWRTQQLIKKATES